MKPSIDLCFIDHKTNSVINIDEGFNIYSAEKFINSLLDFNTLELDAKFFDLFVGQQKDIALEGGLNFSDGKRNIRPSCCCDLYEWPEVIKQLKNSKSPWLGHDPDPTVIFENDIFHVYSDDPNKNINVHKISFSKRDLRNYISRINININLASSTIANYVKAKHAWPQLS